MKKLLELAVLCAVICLGSLLCCAEEPKSADVKADFKLTSADWPWWRGPARNGIANPDQTPPMEWNSETNILWKTNVTGRGHGSATVVGNQIFLAVASLEKDYQAVVCYDRQSGKELWQTQVHQGGLKVAGNKKATLASSSVACDGERVFINFLNNDAVTTTALDRSGKILWQQEITKYTVHQGYGSSPAIYGQLVIVSADNKGGGAIAALNRMTGEIVWKKSRPDTPNYVSPIILKAAEREQLFFCGCDLVSSFDPLTGKSNWEIPGSTTECVTSIVTDGKLIFTSGGYPKNHIAGVAADGSGKIIWEKKTRVYVPSMIVSEGYIYAVADAGVAMCFESRSGNEIWKGRLGGTYSASLVKVGDYLFATSETGVTSIFKANPKKFELVQKNKLCDEIFSTPVICGNRIYLRGANYASKNRQEFLFCIGDKN